MRAGIRTLLSAALLVVLIACEQSPAGPSAVEDCSGFGDWRVSAYVLPYPEATSYPVDQANCSPAGNGHRGVSKFGYDFLMAIGTPIVAARSGVAVRADDSHSDGQVAPTGFDNYLVIRHTDGSFGLYGHFTREGVVVDVGMPVAAGDLIGFSGNTGNTGNKPHLHFSVSTCDTFELGTNACPTLPVNFRNTDANANGLVVGRSYRAGPIQ